MGEIGLVRNEYLYDLTFCDLLCIERGYYRRTREAWSMNRWQTYYIMLSQCGSQNLKNAGIFNPIDLHRFPWEKEHVEPLSEEDKQELLKDMQNWNEFLASQKKEK